MRNLIDELLLEQATLQTPVARFSEKHDHDPDFASHYSQLIPLGKPQPGEQYAFEVNLDRCTGCKACVSACHSMNGLEEEETWRDVGLLHGGSAKSPYLQTVTTACHHCEDPACLDGCPVDAYEKDPHTGIVLHLDDQCIGCQYCALKCPYDVPKYSKKLGIVRKCDMCHSRLAVGEAPACVQACPTQAIRIIKVTPQEGISHPGNLLPGTVSSAYTRPTTRYIGTREIPRNAVPADQNHHRPEHSHWPLVGMLTLTQASVGIAAAALFFSNPFAALLLSTVICLLGLSVSILHLGRPLKAWRVFVGLKHSWLSREIIVFGGYFPLLGICALLAFPMFREQVFAIPEQLLRLAMIAMVFTGVLGVFCSAMLYHDTQRPFWHMARTGFQFTSTAVLIAAAACLPLTTSPVPAIACIILSVVKGFAATECFRAAHPSPLIQASHKLILGPLRRTFVTRLTFGFLGGILLPLISLGYPSLPLAVAALVITLAAETLERLLYFQAVVRHKMPGNIIPST